MFVVRIWCEPREIDEVPPKWRGLIEHVLTGERRYVDDLDELGAFISTYLSEMGVEFGMRWRVKQWLNRLKPGSRMNQS